MRCRGTAVAEAGGMNYRLWILMVMTACAGDTGNSAPVGDNGGGGVSFGGQQDIGEFRGILENGGVPGPETLDANGFFNEHYVDPPACADLLCLTPGVSVGRDWITGAHQATLQIAINTNVDPSTIVRKPLNLVVVVDHSGSMIEDQRLEKVKVGLHTLIDNLQAVDRIALVQFDDSVEVLAPFSETLDRARLHTIVDGLRPAGATNIYDGLRTGFSLASAALSSERQNRVIFLSDGLATAGNTDSKAIIGMADGYIQDGIGLTTIGVGLSFDVALMRGLAEHGAGNFYFIEDAAAATEVFTQELDYFVEPLALGVRVEATAGSGWTFGEIVGSSMWTTGTRTGSMSIPAVFVASRTSQTPEGGRRGGGSMLFIKLTPSGTNDGKVADLKLTYRLPGSTQIITQTVTMTYANNPNETPEETYLSAPEMAERYAMYNVFLGLRYATQEANYNCAVAALQATQDQAIAWNATRNDPDIAADIELIDLYIGNLRENGASYSETTLSGCENTDYPDDDYDYDEGHHGHYYGCYGCASGGNPSGFIAVMMAALVVVNRRRSRRHLRLRS